MNRFNSLRFISFLVFITANVIVAIKSPGVIADFGLWTMAGLTAFITGRSWQHIKANGKEIK